MTNLKKIAMDNNIEEKLRLVRAMKKIAARKGYFMHVAAYIMMTAFIVIASKFDTWLPDSFYETSIFIIVVWGGAGLLLHTIIHFGGIALRCTKWEDRMLRKFMDEEEQSTNRK